MNVDHDNALEMYRSMLRIRRFEETVGDLMAANQVPGFVHLSIGQEAVSVGVCAQLNDEDYITSTHRGHGHCIAKGGHLWRMMAELFGKPAGYCRGRSGSMHIADPTIGILGANAIVGGGFAIAVGAALSAQMRHSASVAVAFFGEGAAGEGVFHECLNLAALWKLPVVFVCENNQYAELSHVSKHLSAGGVAAIGTPHGIPSGTYDGNDVLKVRSVAAEAIDRARAGGGPSLLEFNTYRWRGHFEGDQQTYRDAGEVEDWKRQDPIARLRRILEGDLGISVVELNALHEAVDRDVSEALTSARRSPDADPSLLTQDVYCADRLRT